MKKLAVILLAGWLCASHGAPVDATVRYRMTYGGLPVADVTDTLKFGEDSFIFDSSAKAAGLAKALNLDAVQRKSSGVLLADGSLLTEVYLYSRGDKNRRSDVDRAAGMISWIDDKGTRGEAQISHDHVMDFLSFQYLFYSTGVPVESGEVQMTDGRRVQIYAFAKQDDVEQVQVDYGTFETLRYERVDDSQRQRTVWFAPQLRMIPVKVQIVGEGTVIEFTLQDVEFADS